MNNLLAQNPFGVVKPPQGVNQYIAGPGGIAELVNILLKTMIVGAGIYAVFNIIIAGYSFMSAGGDSKRVEAAWARIWQTILGMAFAAGAFVLAAIIGTIFFGDPTALLRFRLFQPN
jgi:hypothetical protein